MYENVAKDSSYESKMYAFIYSLHWLNLMDNLLVKLIKMGTSCVHVYLNGKIISNDYSDLRERAFKEKGI